MIHGDAVEWLTANPGAPHTSVIASLPDVSELGVTLERWRDFFLASSYRDRPANETVAAMTLAITMNPYFLISK